MSHDPPIDNAVDPILEECLRDALEPYLPILTPDEIAEHRAFLIAFFHTHPVASRLYRGVRQEPAQLQSTERAIEGLGSEDNHLIPLESGTYGRPK
jgi:hypothetical protein